MGLYSQQHEVEVEKEEAKLQKRRGRGKKNAEAAGDKAKASPKKRGRSKKAADPEVSEAAPKKRARSSKLCKVDPAAKPEGTAGERKLTKSSSVASLPAQSQPAASKRSSKAARAQEKVQQSLYDLKFDSLPDLPLPDAKQFTKQCLNHII